MVYRVAAARAARVLRYLWRREMRNRVYRPSFVRVRIRGGREIRALAFVADAWHRQFAGDLDVPRTAELVAQGVGERGSNIDYLSYTLAHMHELGVRDPHLDRILLAALELRHKGDRAARAREKPSRPASRRSSARAPRRAARAGSRS
jgi:cation transport protein ChaC